MKMNFILTATLILLLSCNTEKPLKQETEQVISKLDTLKSTEDFFGHNKTKVLVLGVFHFEYPGLDVKKVPDEDKIDVLVGNRKKEVREVLEYIKRFKPTKIAIEATESFNATIALRAYQDGIFSIDTSARDERYQIAMRLADELQLDTIYAVDASSLIGELRNKSPDYIKSLSEDYDYVSTDESEKKKQAWYAYKDDILNNMTILEYFKYINSPSVHHAMYGTYLQGDFKLDNYRGADNLSINWYNRNLRIFRNIQEITESSEDRIFVLYGNAHAAIFRQLLTYSPDYEFIEFTSLENPND